MQHIAWFVIFLLRNGRQREDEIKPRMPNFAAKSGNGTGYALFIGRDQAEVLPGALRENNSTTPCDMAQIWAENMLAGGRFSGGICWHRPAAAFSRTARARLAAIARAGVRFTDTPLSNIAI